MVKLSAYLCASFNLQKVLSYDKFLYIINQGNVHALIKATTKLVLDWFINFYEMNEMTIALGMKFLW